MPPFQVNLDTLLSTLCLTIGNTNASSVDFFDNVFTFLNESVTVNCCHLNNTLELATCGLGASCAGTCSALGATLCPSGDCTGDCEIPFEQENEDDKERKLSTATKPSSAFKWCSSGCNVWRNKGCCYNPVCRKRSASHRRACRWFNYLTGTPWWPLQQLWADKKISGKTCPFPGSLPHGSWTCEMQEIPIHGISFLDEDAQSYPGELGYFWPAIYSTFLHLFQNIIRMNFDEITSSSSMPPWVWFWLCRPTDPFDHLCQWGICKRVSLSAFFNENF